MAPLAKHSHLYVVDGMDVLDTVLDDGAQLLQPFVWAHSGHRVSLEGPRKVRVSRALSLFIKIRPTCRRRLDPD